MKKYTIFIEEENGTIVKYDCYNGNMENLIRHLKSLYKNFNVADDFVVDECVLLHEEICIELEVKLGYNTRVHKGSFIKQNSIYWNSVIFKSGVKTNIDKNIFSNIIPAGNDFVIKDNYIGGPDSNIKIVRTRYQDMVCSSKEDLDTDGEKTKSKVDKEEEMIIATLEDPILTIFPNKNSGTFISPPYLISYNRFRDRYLDSDGKYTFNTKSEKIAHDNLFRKDREVTDIDRGVFNHVIENFFREVPLEDMDKGTLVSWDIKAKAIKRDMLKFKRLYDKDVVIKDWSDVANIFYRFMVIKHSSKHVWLKVELERLLNRNDLKDKKYVIFKNKRLTITLSHLKSVKIKYKNGEKYKVSIKDLIQ